MKVALVHDWLVTNRGGEKVLEVVCGLFPRAHLYTLIHKPGVVSRIIEDRKVTTSFLQRIPGIERTYRQLLPLFPSAIEAFDLSGYDLVVSSSHCVAKGVRIPPGVRHLSYVHAPMRYMWDLFDDYFGPGRAPPHVRLAALAARPFLQEWDRRSAGRIHRLVANSHHVASKLARYWGRHAQVIHPPVELDRFVSQPLEGSGAGGYFLWLGALAPYKRVDLAVEAFTRLGLPLWIAGGGQEAKRLSGKLPAHIRVLGNVPDEELPALYRGARALVFPGQEDFGLTPLEAQASGRPVIAYGRGGALETVTPRTGVFFSQQTVDALVAAVQDFDRWEHGFQPAHARQNAMRFGRDRFRKAFLEEVDAVMALSP